MTFYDVTGPSPSKAHVWIRKLDANYERNPSFRDYYAGRIPVMRNKNFDPTISIDDDYNVVEVKGANESKVLGHLQKQAAKYGPGLERYPYKIVNNNCARFNYEAYQAGGKTFTKDPNNFGEYPAIYPRDLNEAIQYHNQLYDFQYQNNWIFNIEGSSNSGGGFNFSFGTSGSW
jgi:hypothetical protein